ncbi:hypothetical protein BDR07DRAFT_1309132, partial [Suillus spraguei]
ETRLNAIIFAHQYQQLRSMINPHDPTVLTQERQDALLASFLILILLPDILVSPTERDIRVINVVNPFYVAAAPSYSTISTPPQTSPLFHKKGWRSLQMAIFTCHIQRVLDALIRLANTNDRRQCHLQSPTSSPYLCPGLSRSDVIVLRFNAVRKRNKYTLLRPFLRLLTKSTTSVIKSVLHVLFLPTPFKSNAFQGTDIPKEMLKAGALCRKCAIVNLRIPTPAIADIANAQMPDDGGCGGVHLGQALWEKEAG